MTNENEYDAIVVGARCAGSPTAMLLARQGRRTLLVDRATFPSDTVSTHFIHAKGVAALRRWGVLDHVIASGCPAVDHYSMDFGPVTIAGTPRPAEDGGVLGYCPRRTVLDKILVDAAVEAGAEVREGFAVDQIVVEDGRVVGVRGHGADGIHVEERAAIVVGADGRNSRVAKAVDPPRYNEKPMLQWSYYTYFRDLPVSGMEIVVRPDRGWAALPTNDGLTLVVVGWPMAESSAYKSDVEANFFKTLELAPEFAARVAAATRVERFTGTACDNFFRQPYGPGWALVGDAGYTKDPITAQGITDAFRDAELCAVAIGAWLDGRASFDDALSTYQSTRDAAVGPIYEFTAQLASLAPPPAELQQLLGAAYGNTEAMADFVSLTTGTVSPVDFFDPGNIGRIMGAAVGA
ncbi:MAG TPA: NAD(P)/FAD-dependent oxidoreductase [Acidimicrobiales bacterium]|nr:NAD(P)/FAD-dependent oxidoreductase [Acidimicrobiales bacterium]